VIRRIGFAAAAAFAIALAACGGGGGGGGAVPVTQPQTGITSTSNIPAALLINDYGKAQMAGATYAGPVTNAHITVNVLVHQQNAQALVAYAQSVQNPASSNFRHFLTPDQIATEFGASQSDYQAVAQYFVKNGLAVAGWKQRLLLTVSGQQANVETAFGTKFGLYTLNGKTFIAPMTQPHFSQQLAVDAIGDIVKYHPDHSYIIVPPAAGGGLTVGYSPQTVRAAFDYVGAINAGYNGNGIHLGIIGTGPLDTTGIGNGDVDLNALLAAEGNPSAAHVTEVVVSPSPVASALATLGNPGFPYSGNFQTPPPVTAPCSGSLPQCNPEDEEAQLDTQQASTLAPGASVLFYLAYNAADCSPSGATPPPYPQTCSSSSPDYGPEIGIVEADPEIMQAISDDTADVISLSYGGGETQQGWTCYDCSSSSSSYPYIGSYSNLEFAELAAEGIAVFASSGDNGSAECSGASGTGYLAQQCVSYPAGDPSVVSVGGITASVNAYGQQTAPWLAWGISTFETGYGAIGGSGGGSSEAGGIDIPAPAWQADALGSGVTSREQPDVSMIGDPSTGVAVMVNKQWQGALSVIGGTSVAAPEMAAMWADVLSACKANPSSGLCSGGTTTASGGFRLGNAAPYLYAILKCPATPCSSNDGITPLLSYSSTIYDIIYGDNQMANPTYAPASPIPGYTAGPGYDMVTGVGAPYAGHLINAITGLSVP
jgi:xanthomonalisin